MRERDWRVGQKVYVGIRGRVVVIDYERDLVSIEDEDGRVHHVSRQERDEARKALAERFANPGRVRRAALRCVAQDAVYEGDDET